MKHRASKGYKSTEPRAYPPSGPDVGPEGPSGASQRPPTVVVVSDTFVERYADPDLIR